MNIWYDFPAEYLIYVHFKLEFLDGLEEKPDVWIHSSLHVCNKMNGCEMQWGSKSPNNWTGFYVCLFFCFCLFVCLVGCLVWRKQGLTQSRLGTTYPQSSGHHGVLLFQRLGLLFSLLLEFLYSPRTLD